MYPSEKQFAKLLTKQKIDWQYLTRFKFKIGKNTYRPDFYLPKKNLYIEVIATRTSFYQRTKTLKLMKRYYPQINIIMINPEGKEHLSSKDFPCFDKEIKINPQLYFILKELSIREGTKIKWLLDKAIRNYLKAKKILKE